MATESSSTAERFSSKRIERTAARRYVRRDGSYRVRSHLFFVAPYPGAGLGVYDERRTIPPGSGRPPRVAWGTTRPVPVAEASPALRHSWHVRETETTS
jgi:hypothetical protein